MPRTAVDTAPGLEVWERFSFLGMLAILVLYFADTLANGGLGMSAGTAASVSAAYGTLVYLVSVAGGRLADRVLGSYRAVLWGGVLIACGHYAMAVPTAINIGAFAGPLVTGRLGDHQGWHWGFSAAATGMTFGLVRYVTGRRHLAGRKHAAQFALAPEAIGRAVRLTATGLVIATALAWLLAAADRLAMDLFVDLLTLVSVIAPAGYFMIMFMSPRVTPEERGRLRPYVVLFLAPTTKLAPAAFAGLAVPAGAPWLRRTMHPVH
ncbi:hypothetical protein SSP24_24780 [Streptomyces spinoverrucosus]|uniref:Major facilitator superfamily (MFS) profile domain-containing protein n=1 Tax=Streptomyces spinoverrucosus TaxID=284043 RepID=A0A4Y3VEF7_9ACTN|nr:hypothetical protein SSP24_24780 [Streptomyces spinoverrucosus]GHB59929.1 hypothetical protein GCM10010397_32620 [Streptomyces spinoverrucosus]